MFRPSSTNGEKVVFETYRASRLGRDIREDARSEYPNLRLPSNFLPIVLVALLAVGTLNCLMRNFSFASICFAGAALTLLTWKRPGRLRVTETHLEIRSTFSTKRILRSRIEAMVIDSFIERYRGSRRKRFLVIFVDELDLALGYLSRREWTRDDLAGLHEALVVPLRTYDHASNASALDRRYPKLFPSRVRHRTAIIFAVVFLVYFSPEILGWIIRQA